MKKENADIIKVTIISPEFLFIFLSSMGYYFSVLPQKTDLIATNNPSKWLEILFGGVLLAAFFLPLKDYKSILYPGADTENILVKWEKFYLIKNRFFVTVGYNVLALIICVVYMFLDLNFKVYVCGSALIVTIISTTTFYLAKIRLEELLRRYRSP